MPPSSARECATKVSYVGFGSVQAEVSYINFFFVPTYAPQIARICNSCLIVYSPKRNARVLFHKFQPSVPCNLDKQVSL